MLFGDRAPRRWAKNALPYRELTIVPAWAARCRTDLPHGPCKNNLVIERVGDLAGFLDGDVALDPPEPVPQGTEGAVPLASRGHRSDPLLELILLEICGVEQPRDTEVEVGGERVEVLQFQARARRVIDRFQLGGDGQSGIEGGLDRPERPEDEICVVGFGDLNVGQSEAVGARDDRYAHIIDRDGFAERNAALA